MKINLIKEKLLIKSVFSLILFCSFFILAEVGVMAQDPMVKIDNIARIEGVRDNQLTGYGLVTGLEGTGDSPQSESTIQSVANMLEDFGVEVGTDELNNRNVASVMVTATLPPFSRNGDRIDVQVDSMGDADSLQGGTLLRTPLEAPNGDIYAVAQGSVSIGGYSEQGSITGSQSSKNHATAGRVPEGAIVEKEIDFDLDGDNVAYLLREPDFDTANSVEEAINEEFEETTGGTEIARAADAGRVEVEVPSDYSDNVVEFISEINEIEIRANIPAKVVINERTGTIVMGHNVRISTVSVAHSNIYVRIKEESEVSQPPSFSEGDTETVTEEDVEVDEEEGSMEVVEGAGNIEDLVSALNDIGAAPRDIIAIIQAINEEGALHAELEIM
ncbi:MAG: flagellar basal body P-ring protein FlgI [Bacillota bacterium]